MALIELKGIDAEHDDGFVESVLEVLEGYEGKVALMSFDFHLLRALKKAECPYPVGLTAEGLLRHEPRRGCFVSEVTEADLDDIFPVIALLEGRCAFEAARNATDADLAALEQLHERLNRCARARLINEYYEANFAIHEAIITLANNRWLAQVIGDLRKILRLARLQQLHAPGRLAQSLAEHMAVFAALKARDAEGAEAAMRTHLVRQREALRELARQRTSRISA